MSDSFRVQLDSAGRWFILLSVEDMTPKTPPFQPFMAVPRYSKRSAPPKTEAFALTFQSAGDALPQGTYVFEHETTGRLPLFIVPAGNGTYVAVINRLAVE